MSSFKGAGGLENWENIGSLEEEKNPDGGEKWGGYKILFLINFFASFVLNLKK